MEEQRFGAAVDGRPAGVGPPLARRFARGGDHGGHEDQEVHGQPVAEQRRRERAEGVGHDGERAAGAITGGDGDVGVLGQPGRIVVAGKVEGDGLVPPPFQPGHDEVPRPRAAAGPVDEEVGSRHVAAPEHERGDGKEPDADRGEVQGGDHDRATETSPPPSSPDTSTMALPRISHRRKPSRKLPTTFSMTRK